MSRLVLSARELQGLNSFFLKLSNMAGVHPSYVRASVGSALGELLAGTSNTFVATTAERDAIEAEEGAIVWNSDAAELQVYDGVGWVAVANANELPAQAGHAGEFLSTDGNDASWEPAPEELPDQTGQSGKFLSTDGADAAWEPVPSADLGDFVFTAGAADLDSAGTMSLAPTTATAILLGQTTTIVANKNLALASGSGAVDLSAGSGVFKTTTGANTFGGSSNAFSAAITDTILSIGTAQTAGMSLVNSTAAGAGAQQYSSMLELEGRGWKTNATAASQSAKWALQTRPVEAAANPDLDLVFWSSVNGGGYAERFSMQYVASVDKSLILSPSTFFDVFNANASGIRMLSTQMTLLGGGTAIADVTTTALRPQANVTYLLGGSSNLWKEAWSRSYLGVKQTVAANGAVAIDPTLGETYELTANGNVTSLTISDGLPGQIVTLILIQDAGGLSTWPASVTNSKMVGGLLSKSTTASAIDTRTFRWDGADWLEIGRATLLS